MIKLQKATKQEVKRIALGVCLGTLLMVLVFFILQRLDLSVILGAVLGAAVAIGNFFFLAISVQKAAADFDRAALIMKSSYSTRMLISALVIGLGLVVDAINPIAIVIPMLLPRVTIYVMQFTGLYRPQDEVAEKSQVKEGEE